MPCPLTGPKMFWAGPNFLCQTKKLFRYCGSNKHFVPKKKWFAFSKIVFCAGTKVFEEALNAVKFLGWLKIFGLAQNILRPVKGQGNKINFAWLCLKVFVLCLIYCIILENNSNTEVIEQFENWFRKQTKYTFPFLIASCYRIYLFP